MMASSNAFSYDADLFDKCEHVFEKVVGANKETLKGVANFLEDYAKAEITHSQHLQKVFIDDG
jgi:hypothetical protein